MLPVLISFGAVRIYSWGVLVATAFVACWLLSRWYLGRHGVAGPIATDLVLAAGIGGIVGARALYVFNEWAAFAANPLWVFELQRGGLVFYGGVAGGAVAVLAYTLWRKLAIGVVADAAALALPLGSAIGRIGCLLNGCCGGRPTDAWFGIVVQGGTGKVWPSQLLDAGLETVLLGVLLLLALRARPRAGTLMWVYLTLYPIVRFAVESTRVNPVVAFGLTEAQLISVPLLLVGAAGLAWTLARRRDPGETPGQDAGGSR